jgi:hypothetical protein
MKEQKHRLIIVLGMHRSGSSAVTKGLEAMGVELGDNLMPPDPYNEKGYFEDIEINRLNIEVMNSLGYRWNSLAVFNEATFKKDTVPQLRERATNLLGEKIQDKDILGIKDPRMCRILPFWKPVFSNLDIVVNYVIILRSLDSITASLFRRDSIPRVKSIHLWALHMLSAFEETAGYLRAIVDYDRLVESPDIEIRKLASDLDLESDLDELALGHFCQQFIDASLNHCGTTEASTNKFTPRFISRLESATNLLTAGTLSPDSDDFATCLRETETELKGRSDLLGYIELLDRTVIRQRQALKKKQHQLEELIR